MSVNDVSNDIYKTENNDGNDNDDVNGQIKDESQNILQDSQQQTEQGQQQQAAANTNGGGGGSGRSSSNSNVCRDFLNNVCFRGSRCKYFHPPEMGGATEPKKEEFKFCNDFQNRGCNRENCRYVHCARADVDEYEQTGRMSEALARAIVAVTGQEQVAGRPLCKEYLSGSCSRGSRCRFWHINPREERERRVIERVAAPPPYNNRRGGGGDPSRFQPMPYGGHGGGPYDGGPPFGNGYDGYGQDYRRDAKRQRFDSDHSVPPFAYVGSTSRATSPASYNVMMEENATLRRKIDVLKQTVADLTASNDNLMAENARLRKTATTAATVTDQAIVAASMASAAALSSVLSSSVAGLAPQALAPQQASGILTPEHLAVVSLAAAAQQQQPTMVVQPSIAMSATTADGVHWSLSQIRR